MDNWERDPVPHVEQPLNDTDTRRFWVEFLKNGKRQEVDAQSLRIWRTAELPRFRIEEQERLEAERVQRPPKERTPTTAAPQVAIQSFQEAPASPERPPGNLPTPSPTGSSVQQQEEQEVAQPEVEIVHRAPAREPRRKNGTMDGPNYSNAHTDNIIGDINAGRSTRNRPNGAATLTAQNMKVQLSPYEMLGRSMWEIMQMSKRMGEMMDKEKGSHEAEYDKRDNQDSLERD